MRIVSALFLLFSTFILTSFDEIETIIRRDGVNPPSASFGFVVSMVTVKNVENVRKTVAKPGLALYRQRLLQ